MLQSFIYLSRSARIHVSAHWSDIYSSDSGMLFTTTKKENLYNALTEIGFPENVARATDNKMKSIH